MLRLVFDGRTSRTTVARISEALRVDQSTLFDLANLTAARGLGPWYPPREAHKLPGNVREALDRLIVAVAELAEEQAGQDPPTAPVLDLPADVLPIAARKAPTARKRINRET